jgi:serine/threonine protein phosphatase PrpC
MSAQHSPLALQVEPGPLPSPSLQARTHVGRVRPDNQDSHLIDPKRRFALVADGMGGHEGGQIASALAAQIIGEALQQEGALRTGLAERALYAAFEEAAFAINRRADEDPALATMGTTLTCAALLDSDELLVLHVGDSRLYRLRGGELEQLTHDHNVLGELLRAGMLHPSQIEQNAHLGHLLTRVLCASTACEPDLLRFQPEPGDRYLLSSDGLHDVIEPERLLAVLNGDGADDAIAEALIQAALDAGAPDNVTAVLLTFPD